MRLTTQLWLLYLQPWAINLSLGTVDFSRTYSRTWRVYLAHNLHFYTTLTSSFLRMYSKINDYEDMSTLAMLSDVLSLLTQSDLHHDIMELHKELASMPLRSTREPSNLQTPFRSPSRPSGALGLSEVESVETCALREHVSPLTLFEIYSLSDESGACDIW